MMIGFTYEDTQAAVHAFDFHYSDDDTYIDIKLTPKAVNAIKQQTADIINVLGQNLIGMLSASANAYEPYVSDIDLLGMFAAAGRMADAEHHTEALIKTEAQQGAADAERHANASTRRRYSDDFKADVVARYVNGEHIDSIIQSTHVTPGTLYAWLRGAEVPLRTNKRNRKPVS